MIDCNSFSFNSKRLFAPSTVGWFAKIDISTDGLALLQSNCLKIIKVSFLLTKYSFFKSVLDVASSIISLGKSVNSQAIVTVLFPV